MDAFDTPRLRAARLVPEDARLVRAMHADPTLMAGLGGVRPDPETDAYMACNLEHWARHGFGIWLFRDLQDGRLVGRAGLRREAIGGREELELSYALLPEFWRRGLATEMVEAILALAAASRGARDVVARILPWNEASRLVLARLGFRQCGESEAHGHRHAMYRRAL